MTVVQICKKNIERLSGYLLNYCALFQVACIQQAPVRMSSGRIANPNKGQEVYAAMKRMMEKLGLKVNEDKTSEVSLWYQSWVAKTDTLKAPIMLEIISQSASVSEGSDTETGCAWNSLPHLRS
jgi:hypothetical protein